MTRSSNPRMPLTLAAATALMLGLGGHATAQQPVVHHKTVKVGELDIFYREAGPKDAPAILLLQGFPTSSQMFRNLIPALADRYRVVAPDYVQDYGARSATAWPSPTPSGSRPSWCRMETPTTRGWTTTSGSRSRLTGRSRGVGRSGTLYAPSSPTK